MDLLYYEPLTAFDWVLGAVAAILIVTLTIRATRKAERRRARALAAQPDAQPPIINEPERIAR
jgi:hypothetical protein